LQLLFEIGVAENPLGKIGANADNHRAALLEVFFGHAVRPFSFNTGRSDGRFRHYARDRARFDHVGIFCTPKLSKLLF
jgi:hypothetical protein